VVREPVAEPGPAKTEEPPRRAEGRAVLEAVARGRNRGRHVAHGPAQPRALLPAHIDQRWLLLRDVHEWAKRRAGEGDDGDAMNKLGPPGRRR
jgi:hypothetical protein